MNTTTYTTREEAIQHEIIDVLADDAANHDIDAIADTVLTTTGEGTTYRYTLDETVDFWQAVHENHK